MFVERPSLFTRRPAYINKITDYALIATARLWKGLKNNKRKTPFFPPMLPGTQHKCLPMASTNTCQWIPLVTLLAKGYISQQERLADNLRIATVLPILSAVFLLWPSSISCFAPDHTLPQVTRGSSNSPQNRQAYYVSSIIQSSS